MNYKYLFCISILFLSFFTNAKALNPATILNAEAVIPTPNASGILFVKKGSTGNGSSWADAIGEFSDALTGDNASILQIWVSTGTYQPTAGQSFSMKEGVKIYGGFIGTENELSKRDFNKNTVTLQGNGTTVIVNKSRLTSNSVLDGFTITGGSGALYGGGMYNEEASPTISNCKYINNSATQGGGIKGYYASPVITNCLFSNNTAGVGGAIMFDYTSSPVVKNCSFLNNSSSSNGGAIRTYDDVNLTMTNCIVTGNSSGTWGGALHTYKCTIELANCIFANNKCGNSFFGSEIYTDASNLKIINSTIYTTNDYNSIFTISSPGNYIANSILWAPTELNTDATNEIRNCIIKGETNISDGNINATLYTAEQVFTNPSTGNFTLINNSPAINRGSNDLYNTSAYGNSDVVGGTRIINSTIDMGAFESNGFALSIIDNITPALRTYPNPVSTDLLYIDMESLNSDENATLFDMQGKAVMIFKTMKGINEVNVSKLPKGTYLLQTTQGKTSKIVLK